MVLSVARGSLSPDVVGRKCVAELEVYGSPPFLYEVPVRACIIAPNGETMYLYGPPKTNGDMYPLADQAEAIRCFVEQHRA